jgi:hypothetical protein
MKTRTDIKKRSSEEIIAQLNSNLPVVVPHVEIGIDTKFSENTPTEEALVTDSEEDYNFARTKVKSLLDVSEEAIDTFAAVAKQAQHPRAYEVLDNMIRHATEIAAQLVDFQVIRRKMFSRVLPASALGRFNSTTPIGNGNIGNNTNNAIFVGSTAELQKFLKAQTDGEQPDFDDGYDDHGNEKS